MRPIRLLTAAQLLFFIAACGRDATTPSGMDGNSMTRPTGGSMSSAVTDATVYQLASNAADWVYYRFSADTLDTASNSVHAGRIRARYNVLAQASLDSLGRVDPSKMFADGSMIAKEIYRDGRLVGLAVMYKRLSDPNTGHGGWLWGEYGPGGLPIQSVTTDGRTCHDCHVVGVDHTRMNDAHR